MAKTVKIVVMVEGRSDILQLLEQKGVELGPMAPLVEIKGTLTVDHVTIARGIIEGLREIPTVRTVRVEDVDLGDE